MSYKYNHYYEVNVNKMCIVCLMPKQSINLHHTFCELQNLVTNSKTEYIYISKTYEK